MKDHVAPETDAVLTSVLARFAAVASLALAHPGGWLGHGDDDRPAALPAPAVRRARPLPSRRGHARSPGSLPARAARGPRYPLTGRVPPGAPGWEDPPPERCDAWWVGRIQA